MRNYKNGLDVDFIGGQNQKPLTRDEELALSAYIREYKEKHKSKSKGKKKTVRGSKPKTKQTA